MRDRFTRSGRRVVTLADEEARSLGHKYIGTEHLLLGLEHNLSSTPYSGGDRQRFLVGPDVMHPEKSRSPLVGHYVGRNRAKKAVLRRTGANDLTEKTLARGADEHGEAELD